MNAITPIRARLDICEISVAAGLTSRHADSAFTTEYLCEKMTAVHLEAAEQSLHRLAAAFGYTLTKEAAE